MDQIKLPETLQNSKTKNAIALYCCFPGQHVYSQKMEGNFFSAPSEIVSYFPPGKSSLSQLQHLCYVSGAGSGHGDSNKVDRCPGDQLPGSFDFLPTSDFWQNCEQNFLPTLVRNRFEVGYEVRKECIQPGTSALNSPSPFISLQIPWSAKMKQGHSIGQCLTPCINLFCFCPHDLSLQAAQSYTPFCCVCVSFAFCLIAIFLKVIRSLMIFNQERHIVPLQTDQLVEISLITVI